ncbi:MAG TPA: chemotaxis protein CheW [Rhodocyclaceae bacterium]|nr:chemotaxis protein CheW [Rhodocyclaceae bacterium]
MAIDMTQFYQVFFDESAEHLAEMESLLLDLDVDNPEPEQLNAIFRAAHSIKGSSGTFGFTDLAETTHVLENLLDRIRKQELALRADMVDAFLEAGDILKSMLAAHQGQGQADPLAVEQVRDRLRQLSGAAVESPAATEPAAQPVVADTAPASRRFDIQFVPTAAAATGDGVKHFIEDLGTLGKVEILCSPEGAPDGIGLWQLKLSTAADQSAFTEQLDFIADSGAWRITEDKSLTPDGQEAFGFFSDSPGVPDDELGYGFFEPLPAAPIAEPVQDEGYGFFEPLPTPPAGPAVIEGEGYGFFAPLPAAAPAETPPVAEEGDGYGFFAPLPAPVPEPAPAAPVKTAVETMAAKSATKPAKSGASAAGAGDSSIRVSVEKVDQLINLVGELVITQAMLLQTATKMQDAAPERLLNGLAQLERNTRDLQESVMSIRMLPISFVFSRFPRVVRDLSAKLGKQVELKTTGEATELDKGLIERIADPLTHLIRNSLDHGIELPEQRAAAGKSPVGTITLKAYHQGGNIVIEVGDDGAGLNRQKILAKAREKGLSVSDQMTDQEVFGLIFEAGFSTAEQVTDVSGRGVGMDVVRKNINALGGRVEIESMAGIGTRMTVRLPLTLAILDGMSVAVGDQTYILPLSSVVESLQPRAEDIKTLSNQARVVQVRGEYLPVVVLHELFRLQSCWSSFTQGIMVVLDADGAKAALFVDALVGQHQVVIKSLEANYRRVQGVSGATIMGDGHVALILDVPAIASLARTTMQKAA